ncbi:hypothetical protein [Primorskyibacter sp. 2E233]|uniref:hypothetical protein n=1 Tax=Primorskyibacter sp. 2E233 TaxID=3413431 RepID=UPI003BF25AEC
MRLDAMAGPATPFVWSQHWNATVIIDVLPGEVKLPSTTGFVGANRYFVLFGDRRIHVSWSPALRLSMSTTVSPDTERAQITPECLRLTALDGLSTLIPGIAALKRYRETMRVGRACIMAVGGTDIDDAGRGLQDRHQIGVEGDGSPCRSGTDPALSSATAGCAPKPIGAIACRSAMSHVFLSDPSTTL